MGRYWITRDFSFSAEHQVGLGEQHRCTALHGHEFTVRVLVEADPDHRYMVLDFSELDPFAKVLAARYQGRYLNDFLDQPTSEHIARTLIDELHEAVPATQDMSCAVGVSESPGVWAWCRHD